MGNRPISTVTKALQLNYIRTVEGRPAVTASQFITYAINESAIAFGHLQEHRKNVASARKRSTLTPFVDSTPPDDDTDDTINMDRPHMRAQSPAVTVQSTSTVTISSTYSERPEARSISSTSTKVVRIPPATVPSSFVSLATTSVADFASCYVRSKENDTMFKREEMNENMRIADARLKLESSRFQSDRDVKRNQDQARRDSSSEGSNAGSDEEGNHSESYKCQQNCC